MAELMFVSEFIPEQLLMGEEGYTLATWQTSVLYLQQRYETM
jgi:hypothetical protein